MGGDRLKARLVRYQSQRLARTYEDFLTRPEYDEFTAFFFAHLYPERDTSDRNRGFLALHEKLQKHLGREMTRRLKGVIDLNELSDRLDARMCEELRKNGAEEFGDEGYDRAYVACDNYAERMAQIRLIVKGIEDFQELARKPGIGFVLMLLKPYAIVRGFGPAVDFLQAGHVAFKSLPEEAPIRREILRREVARLNRIYTQYGKGVPEECTKDTRRVARELGVKNADKLPFLDVLRAIRDWV